MSIPRLLLGTCAIGGFLLALLLRLQRVEPASTTVADLPGPAQAQAGQSAGEAEKRNRDLETAIAAERERTLALEKETARLAATPADFQGVPGIAARRKLTRFAEKNQIPQNLLDRFSLLVARSGPASEFGGPPEAQATFAKAAIDLIGEPAFEAYKAYLPTLGAMEAIRIYLQPALGLNALTPGQAEALAEALVAQSPTPGFRFVASGAVAAGEESLNMSTIVARSNGEAVVPFLPGMINRLSAGALEKSSGILSPAQVAYFKQFIDLNRIAVEIAESGK